MTRDEKCADLYAAVKAAFPRCVVTTNKGLNPATPLCVSLRWANGKTSVARARSLNIDFETFKAEAIAQFRKMDATVTGAIVTRVA